MLPTLEIGGFQAFSLCDFPGIPAAVIFLQGCNWRCEYCHNPSLLPCSQGCYELKEIMTTLAARKQLVQGIVLTGGEPTLQKGISDLIEILHTQGFKVKLDTNGTNPEFLEQLIATGNLDYIAMDIKAPWSKYSDITGTAVSIEHLTRSVELLSHSEIPHQFRTTFAPHLLTQADIDEIRSTLPPSSTYIVQKYRQPSAEN